MTLLPIRHLPWRCYLGRAPVRLTQRRTATSESDNQSASNPVLEEFKRKNPSIFSSNGQTAPSHPPEAHEPGDLSSSSVFEDDRRAQSLALLEDDDKSVAAQRTDQTKKESLFNDVGMKRDPEIMKRVLVPDPRAREQWERKKVIQMVRKGGRLTKPQFLKRTEREHLSRSYNMKTSVKKLGMLARQIAGKPIDDAIVQMQFSKKKTAQEVLKQLEFARDEAIVMRGMGLGGDEQEKGEAGKAKVAKPRPIDIQLKSGQRHRVHDRTKIYVDQAWVGRGPYGKLMDYRARGRVNQIRTPWTSLSVVLKEEKTRVREWEEREAKRRKHLLESVWTHLPDRPIQTHRQWYSW